MLHKESSDLLCEICAAPATTKVAGHNVCDACANKQDVVEYLERLTKFE